MSATFTNGHIILLAFGMMCLAIAGSIYLVAQAIRMLTRLDGNMRYVETALAIAKTRARYGVTTAADDEILRRFKSPPEGE